MLPSVLLQLELEKVERLSRETSLHQKISEDMTLITEANDSERARRELTLGLCWPSSP